MAGFVTLGSLLLLSAQALVTNPPAREPLSPTSAWRVDYGNERCIAARTYGSGAEQITLMFERAANPGTIAFGIAGPAVPAQPNHGRHRVRFGDAGALAPRQGRLTPVQSGWLVRVYHALAEVEPQVRSARTVEIELARGGSYLMRLERSSEILDHLDRCHSQLLASWGIDVAAQRALRSPPIPIHPERWISETRIPIFAGQAEGALLLTINTAGVVTDCRVLDSSGYEEVDRAVCQQHRVRARYTPAIGPDGIPVAAQVIRQIHYGTPR